MESDLKESSMEPSACAVCGDDRDVRNHYGVASCFGCKAFFRRTINEGKYYTCNKNGNCSIDKVTRNKCRACRFDKCKKLGMREENLRDTRKNDSLVAHMEDSPESSKVEQKSPSNSTSPLTFGIQNVKLEPVLTFEEKQQRAQHYINFLYSMNRICNDNYDPKYAYVTKEDMIELDKIYGRDVTLEQAIQQPELVAPRTKLRWTYERHFEKEDLSFMWYRAFVSIADFANLIPQFRQLSVEDRCKLLQMNFSTIAWIQYVDDMIELDIRQGFPLGNGSYLPWEFLDNFDSASYPSLNLSEHKLRDYKNFICKNFVEPFRDIEIDAKEICLLKALLLFQSEENLSETGRQVVHNMNDTLIDTVWHYQTLRFPESTFEEKLRRHSRFLLLLPKIGQAWHMESDIHLLMSVFGDINIDGVVKELLFYSSTFEPAR